MLTKKQDRFCIEYMVDSNGTAAAIRAGYGERSANREASRLLKKPHVMERITELRNQVAVEAGVQLKTVVDELTKIAFTNLTDVIANESGLQVKAFSELTPAQQASIAEISETRGKFGTTKRVKMHSKLQALDMLMKNLGGYMTPAELIDRLPPERLEELVNQLLAKMQK